MELLGGIPWLSWLAADAQASYDRSWSLLAMPKPRSRRPADTSHAASELHGGARLRQQEDSLATRPIAWAEASALVMNVLVSVLVDRRKRRTR